MLISKMDYFKTALALLGGILGWFLGGLDSLFYALIAFVMLDYFAYFQKSTVSSPNRIL